MTSELRVKCFSHPLDTDWTGTIIMKSKTAAKLHLTVSFQPLYKSSYSVTCFCVTILQIVFCLHECGHRNETQGCVEGGIKERAHVCYTWDGKDCSGIHGQGGNKRRSVQNFLDGNSQACVDWAPIPALAIVPLCPSLCLVCSQTADGHHGAHQTHLSFCLKAINTGHWKCWDLAANGSHRCFPSFYDDRQPVELAWLPLHRKVFKHHLGVWTPKILWDALNKVTTDFRRWDLKSG